MQNLGQFVISKMKIVIELTQKMVVRIKGDKIRVSKAFRIVPST